MPDSTRDPSGLEADRLIYAGLLGLSVAATLQLIDKPFADSPGLKVAGYSFAFCIPLLAASLITEMVRHNQLRPEATPAWRQLIGLVSAFVAVIGLSAMFFHLGTFLGLLFVVSCMIAGAIVRSL